MNTTQKTVIGSALIVAAGLCGLGFASRPAGQAGAADERGPILVTSSLGLQSAILFVLDPSTRNLAAYEAIPGTDGGLRLLGARKIEHDLELAKYRDLSDFSFFDLRDKKGELGDPNPESGKPVNKEPNPAPNPGRH